MKKQKLVELGIQECQNKLLIYIKIKTAHKPFFSRKNELKTKHSKE
jgi:hypothetical protein